MYSTCGYNVFREEASTMSYSPNIVIPYNKGKTNKWLHAAGLIIHTSIITEALFSAVVV